MTNAEHIEFLFEVIQQRKVKVELLHSNDNRFVDLSLDLLKRKATYYSLVGSIMANWLMQFSDATQNPELLLQFSLGLAKLVWVQVPRASSDLMTAAFVIRSRLFWTYLDSGHADRRLLRAGADLFSACLAAEPTCVYEAEAKLTHYQSMSASQRDGFFEGNKETKISVQE